MKTIRVVGALAALLFATGLLAACGTDEKEEYAQEVEDILQPLGENLQTLGAELSSASDADALATGLGEAESDMEDAASELEALDVPDDVEQVNADLVAAINGFAGDLAEVREAAESGNTQRLQNVALGLPEKASEFEQELNEIQEAAVEAGVPIEDPGEGE
jgi:hypothetical protein